MSKKVTLAASLLLPVALLWSTGCKSKSSTPEQASQPPAQAAPAPSNPAPSGSTPPSSSAAPAPTSSAPASSSPSRPANAAQPAPAASQAASEAESQPAAAPPANVATNAPEPAASPAPPPPPPPPPPVVVPAGTVLHVRLVQPVGSKLSQEGQRFDASLSSPVVVKGVRAIPAGTRVVGTVTEAHPAGRFKGGATLVLDLNSLRLNGQTYTIRTRHLTNESTGKGKRTAGMIGGGTGGGALIGGLAGGGKGALIGGLIGAGAGTVGAATGNRDITLKSEAPLTFQLASSLTLPPRSSKSSDRSAEEPAPTAPQP